MLTLLLILGDIDFVSTSCMVSQVLGLDIGVKPLAFMIEVLLQRVWLFIVVWLLVCGIGGYAVLEMNRKLRVVVALGDAKSSIDERSVVRAVLDASMQHVCNMAMCEWRKV